MKDGSKNPLLRESGVRKSSASASASARFPGSWVRRGGGSQKARCGEDIPVPHQKLGLCGSWMYRGELTASPKSWLSLLTRGQLVLSHLAVGNQSVWGF